MADDQCAVDPLTGELMDAEDITDWRFSPSLDNLDLPSVDDLLKRVVEAPTSGEVPAKSEPERVFSCQSAN